MAKHSNEPHRNEPRKSLLTLAGNSLSQSHARYEWGQKIELLPPLQPKEQIVFNPVAFQTAVTRHVVMNVNFDIAL